MSFASTNKAGLQIARQSAFDTLGGSPVWRRMQPNGFPNFGATLSTVTRRPISTARQLGPGVPVALDALSEFDHDATMQVMVDTFEALCFAQAANWDLVFEGVAATGTGYTIPAATANQAGKIQWNNAGAGAKSLFFARGYANAANNGLRVLTADTGGGATTLTFGSGTVETPPTNAVVELAGIRAIIGDLAIVVSGSTATLTSRNNGVITANAVDFTTCGIKVGQFIHIGGTTSAFQFSSGVGYGRVLTIAAATITLDKLVGTLITDAGAGVSEQVDLLFGRFVRNVPVDHNADDDRYLQVYHHLELVDSDLESVGVDRYEYAINALASQVTLNLPLSEKATMNVQFVGTDVESPVTSRKTGASTPILPLQVEAFSTAINISNLRTSLLSAADTGFKSVSLTLNNNVNPEKVLGILPSKSLSVGIFAVEVGATMLFSNATQISSPRANDTVSFDFIMKNADGAVAIDVPSMKLGDSKRDYPLDKGITIDLPGTAFEDATLHTSLSASFFPVVP